MIFFTALWGIRPFFVQYLMCSAQSQSSAKLASRLLVSHIRFVAVMFLDTLKQKAQALHSSFPDSCQQRSHESQLLLRSNPNL